MRETGSTPRATWAEAQIPYHGRRWSRPTVQRIMREARDLAPAERFRRLNRLVSSLQSRYPGSNPDERLDLLADAQAAAELLRATIDELHNGIKMAAD